MTTNGTARRWMLTINNPGEDLKNGDDMDRYLEKNPIVSFAAWQVEHVSTTHIQMYLRTSSPVRLSAVKKIFPTCHAEKALGTEAECIKYCSKEESRTLGPFTFGIPSPGQGSRTDLMMLSEAIAGGASLRQICRKFPREVIKYPQGIKTLINNQHDSVAGPKDVYVYYGKTGTGKTRKAHEENPNAWWAIPPDGRIWFDGYIGQECAIFDDFRPSWMKLSTLLRLTDRYPMTVEVKGATTAWIPKKIIFTSDTHPKTWFDTDGDSAQFMRRVKEVIHFSNLP